MFKKYAISPDVDLYLEFMKFSYNNEMASSVIEFINKEYTEFDNPELFDMYYEKAINEATLFNEFKNIRIASTLDGLFNGREYIWTFDSYRFALTVEIECDEDEEFPLAIEYGFKEFPMETTPVFRSPFLKFQDIIYNIYPDDYKEKGSRPRSITMQLTEDCNLCCTYCYQINKTPKVMSWETAKKFIDGILDDTFSNGYIDIVNSPSMTLEFVGGEGLLEITLIDKILTYLYTRMIDMNHPWLYKWSSFIGSNGVLYFKPEVQRVLNKWNSILDIAITLDGDKKLHDKCRIFPDGSGSYEFAEAAVKDRLMKNKGPNTKLTISPDNLEYLVDAIKNFIDLGLVHLWSNCIYEHVWTKEEGNTLYNELKKIADYLIDTGYADSIDYSMFSEDNYLPLLEKDIQNWCGGDGSMLAVDTEGILYNCLRYMPSSLGPDIEPLSIGTVDTGIGSSKRELSNINCMQCIDRRSQSIDECFYCPIGKGCSWCSAYNYQVFGTPNKRSTNICNVHKAEALANSYFWNKYYRSINSDKRFKVPVTYDFIEGIISQQEYNMLLELSRKE